MVICGIKKGLQTVFFFARSRRRRQTASHRGGWSSWNMKQIEMKCFCQCVVFLFGICFLYLRSKFWKSKKIVHAKFSRFWDCTVFWFIVCRDVNWTQRWHQIEGQQESVGASDEVLTARFKTLIPSLSPEGSQLLVPSATNMQTQGVPRFNDSELDWIKTYQNCLLPTSKGWRSLGCGVSINFGWWK